jgi:hypothetical protein
MLTNQNKNSIKRSRLLPNEPYEMTYWKEKLQSPFFRLQMGIKQWWINAHGVHTHS